MMVMELHSEYMTILQTNVQTHTHTLQKVDNLTLTSSDVTTVCAKLKYAYLLFSTYYYCHYFLYNNKLVCP